MLLFQYGVQVEDFISEAKMRQSINHKNLVQLYAVCTTSTPVLLIMEHMSNKTLYNYLKEDKGDSVTLQIQVDIISQVHHLSIYTFSVQFSLWQTIGNFVISKINDWQIYTYPRQMVSFFIFSQVNDLLLYIFPGKRLVTANDWLIYTFLGKQLVTYTFPCHQLASFYILW